jgi:hypothetical protein
MYLKLSHDILPLVDQEFSSLVTLFSLVSRLPQKNDLTGIIHTFSAGIGLQSRRKRRNS